MNWFKISNYQKYVPQNLVVRGQFLKVCKKTNFEKEHLF